MKYGDMQKYEPKQRAAICYSKFRGEAVHPDFQRIINLFFKRYRVDEAIEKFGKFVMRNSLNLSKAYNPNVQFKESFEWIEPLIQPYKQDKDAKYYLVTALTADISMNNVDYGSEDRLAREDSSMNWRPVNINHDHDKWLSYPRTRVDFSAANEFSLEATLRVDNRDAWLQKMLDEGKILHPSIEGRPHPISGRYHFTGLALLEKGVELPGCPLTEIVPLVFNESVGKSICEFKGGKMVCECTTTSEVKNNLKESVKQAIKEVFEEEEKPMLKTPEQSSPNAEKPPKEPEECPTGFHWDGQQCMPNDSGDSAKSPMTKMPGPKPVMYEQDVPPATNAPNTVGKDDTATCPENHHWDPDQNKCVPDVKQECEAGWHFDVALEKCIPDNPQVNESKLRLKVADYELQNIQLNEEKTELKEENESLKTQQKRKDAESTKLVEKLTQGNYTKDGIVSEQNRRIDSLEGKDKRNVNQLQELTKREQNALQHLEEMVKSRDSYKEMYTSERVSREATVTDNERLGKENLGLTNQLTEMKSHEIQWTKDKQTLQEGLTKALKHQKYVYEFLKTKGFEIVNT
jgi:hypothetical protein